MKSLAAVSMFILAAFAAVHAQTPDIPLAFALAASPDSAGGGSSSYEPAGPDAGDTLRFHQSVADASRYTKPGPIDFITDLPGAWGDWGKHTFQTRNIPLYTGIGLLTAAMVTTDHETYTPFRKLFYTSTAYHNAAKVFQFMGDGWFQFGIGAVLAAHGFAFNNAKSLSTASQTVEVILACGGVVQTLKHLTGRESPFVSTSPTGKWVLFPNQLEYAHHVPHYDAYPSGHVATAMATLTVLTENYPDATWLKYVGYPTIGLIGLGMMGTGIHWMSDYPLSWVLGYSFGKAVARRHMPAEEPSLEAHRYAPQTEFTILNNGSPGIALIWAW